MKKLKTMIMGVAALCASVTIAPLSAAIGDSVQSENDGRMLLLYPTEAVLTPANPEKVKVLSLNNSLMARGVRSL